jgi:hypothetical protein
VSKKAHSQHTKLFAASLPLYTHNAPAGVLLLRSLLFQQHPSLSLSLSPPSEGSKVCFQKSKHRAVDCVVVGV